MTTVTITVENVEIPTDKAQLRELLHYALVALRAEHARWDENPTGGRAKHLKKLVPKIEEAARLYNYLRP